ncbi:MAG: DNA starvation/stationary phase protection protein [Gammaproteobacteria bacterium]|jgi:starvation-inducible DNA-binding protein
MFKKAESSKKPNQKLLIEKLSQYLASTYSLYLKTQNFHWNVTGSEFLALHSFFEKQYDELAEAIDLIAEQIRTFGVFTPGSFTEFSKLSKIKDAIGKKNANNMLKELLTDHLLIIDLTKELLSIAKDCNNDVTQDMLINRSKVHEKTIWMLRSFLG